MLKPPLDYGGSWLAALWQNAFELEHANSDYFYSVMDGLGLNLSSNGERGKDLCYLQGCCSGQVWSPDLPFRHGFT